MNWKVPQTPIRLDRISVPPIAVEQPVSESQHLGEDSYEYRQEKKTKTEGTHKFHVHIKISQTVAAFKILVLRGST